MVVSINEAALLQFEQYLAQISLSPKTIASYLADINVFTRWATEVNSDEFFIVQVTPDQIRAYLTYLLNDLGRAPSTANRHLQALRKWCAYLVELNLAPINATEEISLVSIEKHYAPETLSPEEVISFLAAANNTRVAMAKRDQAILSLLVKAGLRVAEVVGLQTDDVIFDYPGVHLTVRDSRGWGIREIPLVPDVCRDMKEHLMIRSKTATSPHVFLTQEGNPLSTRTVQRIVSRCAKKAQLVGVTAQLLRRTYAMQLLTKTSDLNLVTERLGHQTTRITLRYLQLEDTQQQELMSND